MWFTLPLPPGINKTYGTNKTGAFYKKNAAKEWETEAGWEIKKVWKNSAPIQVNCSVSIVLVLARDRDIDSCTKIVFDLLQKHGVIANDALITKATQEKYRIKKGIIQPHIRVVIAIV